jgi:isopentenyl-diphosphate delta-isomerase
MTEREQRKDEHIEAVKKLPDPGTAGFDDLVLLPAVASEIEASEVSLSTRLMGRTLKSPIIINAMTGGTARAARINEVLAVFASQHGLAMAVGSETAGLQANSPQAQSFRIVRDANPHGVVIANVGMGAEPDLAQRAVDLVSADFLQIHWNTAQELFMTEGDRDFRYFLERLAAAAGRVTVPIIAKEVGQGMTGPAARRFIEHGAAAVDIGGRGGTNFIAVEAWRAGRAAEDEWLDWGLTTPVSLLEVRSSISRQIPVVACGGIRSGHDIAKCLAAGAQAVGIAGPLLRLADAGDHDQLDQWLAAIHDSLRKVMILTGAPTIAALGQRPLVVRGAALEWMSVRGLMDYVYELGRRDQ